MAIAMNALLKREIILFDNDGRRACLKLAERGLSDFMVVRNRESGALTFSADARAVREEGESMGRKLEQAERARAKSLEARRYVRSRRLCKRSRWAPVPSSLHLGLSRSCQCVTPRCTSLRGCP